MMVLMQVTRYLLALIIVQSIGHVSMVSVSVLKAGLVLIVLRLFVPTTVQQIRKGECVIRYFLFHFHRVLLQPLHTLVKSFNLFFFFFQSYWRCVCESTWGGPDCSTQLTVSSLVSTNLFNTAHLSEAGSLAHWRKMLPRLGHTLSADRRGALWMIGGYSLSHGPLNDIRLFDTKNNTWMQASDIMVTCGLV